MASTTKSVSSASVATTVQAAAVSEKLLDLIHRVGEIMHRTDLEVPSIPVEGMTANKLTKIALKFKQSVIDQNGDFDEPEDLLSPIEAVIMAIAALRNETKS